MSIHRFTDARRDPRVRVPAMYSDVRARPKGARRYAWAGHVYDISRSGMSFEFDEGLKVGEAIEVRLVLPGLGRTPIRLSGRVVRVELDDDEPGPVRMAMSFATFHRDADSRRLEAYLAAQGLRIAA
jgi:hypothetical protein